MGNEFCFSRNHQKQQLLDEEELSYVKRLYDKLKCRYQETYDRDFLNEQNFLLLIPERPIICSKLYRHLYNGLGEDNKKLDFQVFAQFVGRLIKRETLYRMTRVELYIIISIQRESEFGDYNKEKISYLDAFDLLMEIEFYLAETGYIITDYEAQDESTARSILSRLYSSNSGSVMFYELNTFLDQNFSCLTNLITKYFYQLFVNSQNQVVNTLIQQYIPPLKFTKPSYLLNNSTFGYMSLSNQLIYEAESFNLIWTSAQNGWKFESLYQALISFKGPTLILIKFDERTNEDSDDEELKQSKSTIKQGKYSIVGAFNATQWIETNSYQGTSQNTLFQIYPKFTPISTCNDVFKSRRLGSQNFSYLNKEFNKKGLGFGGNMKTFRLWLDAEYMQHSSYALQEGEPYIKGDLIDPSIITASVSFIEVWGIGEQEKSINSSEKEIKIYRDSTTDLILKYG